jgi:endonuclease/exonuclease/phosphatase family metal-dependent hydrolase
MSDFALKIGFWNVNKSPRAISLAAQWALEAGIDLLVLIECTEQPAFMLQKLNDNAPYFFYSPHFALTNTNIHVFSRLRESYSKPVLEESGFLARDINLPLHESFTLAIVHLPSKLYYRDEDQNSYAHEIGMLINSLEKRRLHKRTVVIGDFNMDPFEPGMVASGAFHAVMDRHIAQRKTRTVKGHDHTFFYNPMWGYFGSNGRGKANGTYFYPKATPVCQYWHIFDQVLIRPDLLDSFADSSLVIHTEIGGQSLLREEKIDSSVSDHLPVSFVLNLKQANP